MTTLTPNTYTLANPASIVPSRSNRKHFDVDALQALSDNIKARGIDQPIIIRPLPGSRLAETFDVHKGQPKPAYEIVSGERRYRAARMAGLAQVPVILRSYTDAEAIEAQLIENIQRESLSELDEAEGFDYWLQQHGITTAVIADKINKSVRYVQARLQLLKLQPETKQALRTNQIDVSRAVLLSPVHDPKLQIKALEFAATVPAGGTQPSVRDLAIWLRQNVMLDLARAPFQITAANLVPLAGSCKSCPKRTGADPDMFSHVDGADICTDPPCYNNKAAEHIANLEYEAKRKGLRLVHGAEAKAACYPNSSTLNGYSPLSQVRNDVASGAQGQRLDVLLGHSHVMPLPGAVLIENPFTRELIAAIPTKEAEAALLAKGLVKVLAEPDIKADKAKTKKDVAADIAKLQANAAEQVKTRYSDLLVTQLAERLAPQDVRDLSRRFSPNLLRTMFFADFAYQIREKVFALVGVQPHERDDLSDLDAYRVFLLCLALEDGEAATELAFQEGINLSALKHQAADEIKVKTTAKIAALKPQKTPAPKSPLAQPSTAPAADAKAKTTKPKGKAKLSAKDAQLGIAEAMQGIEGPGTGLAKAAPLAVGHNVTVCDATMLRPIVGRFAGMTGTITASADDEWQVKLDKNGRGGGVRQFMASEIEAAA